MPDPRNPNHVQEAFARAAGRGGPLFRKFVAYRYTGATDDRGRPLLDHVDWQFSAPGSLRWRDVDQPDRADPNLGHGLLTLFLAWPGPTPDYILTTDAEWLLCMSALDADALNASLKLQVKRWAGEPPTILYAGP